MWSEAPIVLGLWTALEIRSWNPGAAPGAEGAGAPDWRLPALALLVFLAAAAFAVAWRARRRERRRRAVARRKMRELFASRGVTEIEEKLVDALVRASGEQVQRVTRLVVSFDRSIDAYLQGLQGVSEEDRLALLRRLKSLRAKLGLNRVAPGVPLLSTRELEPGQTLLCRVVGQSGARVMAATLVDIDDAGLLVELSAGANPAAPAQPFLGSELEVYFQRQGDGSYRFQAHVFAEPDTGARQGRRVCVLGHPVKLGRENRRHSMRVPLHEPIEFALLPHPTSDAPLDPVVPAEAAFHRRGTVLDLSSGGLRLAFTGGLAQPEDLVLLSLPFLEPPHNRAVIRARVNKVHKQDFELGLTFDEPAAEVLSAIAAYVESLHRELIAG